MPERRFAALDEMLNLVEPNREVISRSGKPVIGWFCSYTPLEIIQAAGLHPYRIVPEPGKAMTRADTYIDRNFCPYVRTCLGEALDEHYRFLDGLVVVNSCDPMRRLYDVWRYNVGGDFVHLLDLPRVDNEAAIGYYRKCLLRFAREIEARYKVTISDDSLAVAIDGQNRVRSLLRELYEINQGKGMPLSAVEIYSILRAGMVLPSDVFTGLLERLLDEVGDAAAEFHEGPRLLITGSILENPLIIELIEQCGARVVSDDLCNGTRQFWQTVEPEGDPLTNLSRYYLGRTPCPRMRDAQRRFDHIFRLVDEFRADGVIIYTLKFCDPFLYDVPGLKGQLVDRGIPNLMLEGDYTPGTLGRVKTRIEAFIEMLSQDVRAV